MSTINFCFSLAAELFIATFRIMASSNPSENNDTSNTEDEDNMVELIASMGFDDLSLIRTAVKVSEGNIESAINYLLSPQLLASNLPHSATPLPFPNISNTVETVQGTKNQFSTKNGRSACTCIALQAAEAFLTLAASNTETDGLLERIITPDFIDNVITNGAVAYETYMATIEQRDLSSTISTTPEHTSVEEVMDVCSHLFPNLIRLYTKRTRQGVLSYDPLDTLNLQSQLLDIFHCSSRVYHKITNENEKWMCIVLTKTPETVLLILPPPPQVVGGANFHHKFLLFDSHPRGTLYQQQQQRCDSGAQVITDVPISQGYCRIHDSVESLCQLSLSKLFPVTNLGDDVSEMMSIMYNSFDLYPFY